MSILTWNSRGAYAKSGQLELQKILNDKDVELFGDLETKATIEHFEEAMTMLGNGWNVLRNWEIDGTNCDSI